MVALILIEIVALPAERSRGRHNPRVVKRKMSSFPTKARAAPPSRQVFRYAEHIRIVAPVAGSAHRAPPIPPLPCRRQSGLEGRRAKPAPVRLGSSTSALGGPAACRASPTAPVTIWTCAPSIAGWRALEQVSAQTAVDVLNSTVLR
jgi:hypothetical protein